MIKNYDYYQEQINRLKIEDETIISIKFTASYPNSETKFMSLNKDNIDIFINFLQELKNRMS